MKGGDDYGADRTLGAARSTTLSVGLADPLACRREDALKFWLHQTRLVAAFLTKKAFFLPFFCQPKIARDPRLVRRQSKTHLVSASASSYLLVKVSVIVEMEEHTFVERLDRSGTRMLKSPSCLGHVCWGRDVWNAQGRREARSETWSEEPS